MSEKGRTSFVKKWNLREWLLFAIPASLLLGSRKLGGLPLYLPEVLVVCYVLVAITLQRSFPIREAWRSLPLPVRLALICIGLSLVGAVWVAPSSEDALGALKTWFIVPGILLAAFLSFRERSEPLYVGLISLAILETIWGIILLPGAVELRLKGTFDSPNFYAALVVPAILIASTSYLPKTVWLRRVILITLIGGLLLSQSLGGFIGLAVALVVVAVRSEIGRPYRSLMLGSLLMLALIGGYIGYQRFQNIEESSLVSRVQIWKTAFAIGKERPFTGVGLRGFEQAYIQKVGSVVGVPVQWAVPEPHNLYLAFWMNLGILGLVGFVMLLGYLLSQSTPVPAYYALVAILGHGLVDTPFFKTELSFSFWILVALVLVELIPKRRGLQ